MIPAPAKRRWLRRLRALPAAGFYFVTRGVLTDYPTIGYERYAAPARGRGPPALANAVELDPQGRFLSPGEPCGAVLGVSRHWRVVALHAPAAVPLRLGAHRLMKHL